MVIVEVQFGLLASAASWSVYSFGNDRSERHCEVCEERSFRRFSVNLTVMSPDFFDRFDQFGEASMPAAYSQDARNILMPWIICLDLAL